MQSKQYFTKIKNYPHEKSTKPEKAAFKVGVSVDKDGVRFFMFGYFYI